jgi:hypothetical protein
VVVVRSLQQHREFKRLARAVEPLGIRLLVLKGLHLASSVYPKAWLREMNDIDVLVRLADVVAVAEAAITLGYRPVQECDLHEAMPTWHHLPRFINPHTTPHTHLEVHWRLAPESDLPRVNSDDLWRRAEPNPLAPNAWQLSPEDVLLHVCAHAAHLHALDQGLRPLCDVRALLAAHGQTLDWAVVASRSAEWGCDRGVALVLRLAHRLLDAEIPESAFRHLAAALPSEPLVVLAVDQILGGRAAPDVSSEAGRLFELPSLGARIRHTWSRLFLPNYELRLAYAGVSEPTPNRLRLLARRWRDLIRRYARSLLHVTMRPHGDARRFIDRRNQLAAWLRRD